MERGEAQRSEQIREIMEIKDLNREEDEKKEKTVQGCLERNKDVLDESEERVKRMMWKRLQLSFRKKYQIKCHVYLICSMKYK